MPVTCEQLCSSISCHKLCQIMAKTDAATYLVIMMSAVSAILSFVLSITQIKSSVGMVDTCTKNDLIELLSPFSMTGTKSNGTHCFGYCSWPSNNTNLRLTSLSFFIILMIAMIYAMKKLRYIWLVRILLFIELTLLFTSLVQDFSALIAGKKACDNDFKIIKAGEEYQVLQQRCDDEILPIETCSLEPYIYIIFADMFVVIMCGALWQLIGYYKASKAQVIGVNNCMLQQQQHQQVELGDEVIRDDSTGNVESEGVGDSTNSYNPSFMKQYEDY